MATKKANKERVGRGEARTEKIDSTVAAMSTSSERKAINNMSLFLI